MAKREYFVFQPYEIWYKTRVEANTAEEAIAKAKHPAFDGEWELDLETGLAIEGDWDAWIEGGADDE